MKSTRSWFMQESIVCSIFILDKRTDVLPETQFVWTRLRMDTTQVLYVGGFIPPWGAAREGSEFNIKPPLGAPLLIFFLEVIS